MSLTLPIQVGKQYVRRDGAVVTARKHEPGLSEDTVYVPVDADDVYDSHVFIRTGRSSSVPDVTRRQDLIADHIPATGHPHAALMAQYAADAAETAEPWLRWECRRGISSWVPLTEDHPVWALGYEYRRKPKTIRIGEHDVTEPLRMVPEEGTPVFAPAIERELLFHSMAWDSHDLWCSTNLARGLVHLTREAAEQHARALLAFTQVQP